ncbi:MAG TPA: GNAT family N-acetyltransferase [Casimicrobiaceae bacterium]|nr:GNAT family N-acetyltransferase [Casimicrobiaceae bacterium]
MTVREHGASRIPCLSQRFELKWCARTAEIPEDLWRACFSPPREGLFWYRALECGNLADQFTFAFGLLQVNGAPVGIVPTFLFDLPLDLVIPPAIARFVLPIARGPLRGLAFQKTFFIGNVAGEEGRIGLVPGTSLRDFVPFIHDAARVRARTLGASMIVWKDFAAGDRAALDELVESGRAFRTVSYPGTTIPLVSGGYGAFVATLRSERRWKINNKLRRGAKKVALATSIVTSPSQDELKEMFSLFWQTYARGTTKFERLTPEFFAAIAESDKSTFIVQREASTGRMLAFMLMLDLGERVINQFIGIDYAAADGGFVYFRLFAAAYDWACTTGARFMQSGQTGYMAKLDLGHCLVPLWNYCQHRSPVLQRVYRRVGARITWDTLDGQLHGYLSAHPDARAAA